MPMFPPPTLPPWPTKYHVLFNLDAQRCRYFSPAPAVKVELPPPDHDHPDVPLCPRCGSRLLHVERGVDGMPSLVGGRGRGTWMECTGAPRCDWVSPMTVVADSPGPGAGV